MFKIGDTVIVKEGHYSDYPPTSRYNIPRHAGVVERSEPGFVEVKYGDVITPPLNPTSFVLVTETRSSTALDVQIGGDHYKTMLIQPMEYSMKNGLDACQHTIIKYVTRFRDKGGIEDLEKAKHCIDLLIGFEKEKENG